MKPTPGVRRFYEIDAQGGIAYGYWPKPPGYDSRQRPWYELGGAVRPQAPPGHRCIPLAACPLPP